MWHRLFFLALIVLAPLSSANAATVYHLICRGGDGTNNSLFMYVASANGAPYAAVDYRFERYVGTKASVKTDGSHLAPGQCSWSTNVLASNYYRFTHTLKSNVTLLAWYDRSVTPDFNRRLVQDSAPRWHTGLMVDRSDLNLSYLPSSEFDEPDRRGTILDPSMIFHIYVSIENGNLIFRYVKRAERIN